MHRIFKAYNNMGPSFNRKVSGVSTLLLTISLVWGLPSIPTTISSPASSCLPIECNWPSVRYVYIYVAVICYHRTLCVCVHMQLVYAHRDSVRGTVFVYIYTYIAYYYVKRPKELIILMHHLDGTYICIFTTCNCLSLK